MGRKGVIQFWDRYAKSFTGFYSSRSIVDLLFRQGIIRREEKALSLLGGRPGATVLDLGCGPGKQVIKAVQNGASLAVGVDAAPEMLQFARQEAKTAGVENEVEFHLSDIFSYQDDRVFDIIWALGVFDYVPDPDRLVRIMAKLSNGIVAASFRRIWVFRFPFRKLVYCLRKSPAYFYSAGRVRAIFERNGLTDVKVEVIDRALYFVTGKVGKQPSNPGQPASAGN